MRTTLQLDDELMREAKACAARAGTTLTSFIEDAVRQALATVDQRRAGSTYKVSTFRSRVQPGVDLDSNEAVLEAMEAV